MSNDGVCHPQDQHISASTPSVSAVAPSGMLITGYCVKAGSINQDLGPEEVTLPEPVASVIITHSSGKDVSHYVLRLTPSTTTTVSQSTTVVGSTTTAVSTTLPEITTPTDAVTTTTVEPPDVSYCDAYPEECLPHTSTPLPEDPGTSALVTIPGGTLPKTGPADMTGEAGILGVIALSIGIALVVLGRKWGK